MGIVDTGGGEVETALTGIGLPVGREGANDRAEERVGGGIETDLDGPTTFFLLGREALLGSCVVPIGTGGDANVSMIIFLYFC